MSSLSARHTMTIRREQAQGTQAFRPVKGEEKLVVFGSGRERLYTRERAKALAKKITCELLTRPCTIRRAPQEDQTATPSSWAMCRPNIWGEWNITAEETRIRACKASWLDTR
jgi:hypothetical protein